MKKSTSIIRFLLLVCFSLYASALAFGATFTVNSTADVQDANPGNGVCETAANVCTLRAAITEANALAGDDIITLPAGTYTQALTGADNTNAGGDWDITSNITINGAGADNTILQANVAPNTSVERVIHFVSAGTSTLGGVTIRHGKTVPGTHGAGMRVEHALNNAVNVTLNNVIIRDNIALGRGGGLYVSDSTLTVNNSTITNNQSSTNGVGTSVGGGGVYQAGGTATYNNTNIDGNMTDATGSTFMSPAPAGGGGITFSGGTLNLNFSTVNNNTATGSQSNSFGGGIYMPGATVNLTNSSVNNNTAAVPIGTGSSNSGGIENQGGTLTLDDSTVSGNTAGSGGGIRVFTTGGFPAYAFINRSAIVNNTATGSAGGILTVSTGTAAAITILNNSTVGGNAANGDGGGILTYAASGGDAITTVQYSTVASNRADADNNGAGNGGGLANLYNTMGQTGFGLIYLKSSVVADNTSGTNMSPDIANSILSLGYNHVENTTGGTFTTTTGDVIGIDPGLTSMALNGGTTLNFLPSADSALINQIPNGTNECGAAPFNVDQRNASRPLPQSGACDKGSVERASPLTIGGVVSYGIAITGNFVKFVQGVQMSATGASNDSTNTDSTGTYLLSNLTTGGQYTVTPTKSGNVNGITAFDATLVLRCVAAGNNCTLTPNQKIAANTDGDSGVTAFDATQILRFVAANGSNANTGNAGKWKFVDPMKTYNSLSASQTNQNYTAYLVGEVDGDWAP